MQSRRLTQIYACLTDETRLRILSLLNDGPLCVNHLQEIMGVPQVQISKHLGYLRTRGMVEAKRHRNMMIYHLPLTAEPEVEQNLVCLRDCVRAIPMFIKDKEKLYRFLAKNGWLTDIANGYGIRPIQALKKGDRPRATTF
ncbi:MAG: metalloregulator ArsR/SmtB family transcription factor [Verrucomicrobium sp.]|nr:metalloregulator ArsR/SmtB family transcription factor [Verrucomicrobium sp.]